MNVQAPADIADLHRVSLTWLWLGPTFSPAQTGEDPCYRQRIPEQQILNTGPCYTHSTVCAIPLLKMLCPPSLAGDLP